MSFPTTAGNDGHLYVASRGTWQILRYRFSDDRADAWPFIDDLDDEPEFIERVARHKQSAASPAAAAFTAAR